MGRRKSSSRDFASHVPGDAPTGMVGRGDVDRRNAALRRRGRSASLKAMRSVADRAYEMWEARGRPLGDDLRDWFAAERESYGAGQPRMQLITLPPLAFSLTLENPIVGICLASVQGNAEGTSRVPILPCGFFTSDDGPEMYVYLDRFG
jgi:hypothetical protein